MAKRSTVRGNKQLKPRQVALVKNLVDGMTITEAARRAGYSKKCPGQAGYQALQNLKLKMPELLDRLGLSEVVLIEKHLKPMLSAQTTKFFQHRGKVAGKRLVTDNEARLNALDLAFKLRGSYAQADHRPAEAAVVKVIIMDAPRPPPASRCRGESPIALPCPSLNPNGRASWIKKLIRVHAEIASKLDHLAKPLEKNRRVGSNRHARQPVRSPPGCHRIAGPFAPTPLIKRFQPDQDGLLPT
jgi:hypothetical protein